MRELGWGRRWQGVCAIAAAAVLVAACSGSDRDGGSGQDDAIAQLEAKPADFVQTYSPSSQVAIGEEVDEAQGRFWGPHFELQVTRSILADGVSEQTAVTLLDEEAGYRAADGHRLAIVQFGQDPAGQTRWDGGAVTARVLAGGHEHDLGALPDSNDVLVVSVPKGEPALLEVTDEGHAQTFDLSTAERVDVHKLLYPLRSTYLKPQLYQGTGQASYRTAREGFEVRISGGNPQASLEPYVPTEGWAKPGRAWLLLSGLLATSIQDYSYTDGTFPAAVELQAADSFAVQLPGGRSIRANKQYISTSIAAGSSGFSVVFDVPDSLRSATLVITPRGPLATDTSTPTTLGMDALVPHTDCGKQPDVVCLSWSPPPPRKTVRLTLE